MEFRETLLAAQRNQQQKSSGNSYYKARFEPPKKIEQKPKDKLSANIQKFLAKQEEEEKQKQLEVNRKRDELLAMRDPKAMRKIQKSLKVFRSANKAVIADAIDRDNTAVTRAGPEQPDQDDYGYESQEAAAIYEKMMQKYSKIPEVPKFPAANTSVKKDLNGTRERVRQALQHEDDPVPHKRQRRKECSTQDRDSSPPSKYEPEKKKDDHKPEKPKIRKPVPPPMDFNQLLKLAEKKKSEPIEVNVKKQTPTETESTERLMTKKQKKEYEEEMARRQRRQERIDAEKSGKKKEIHKDEKIDEKDKKLKLAGFGRIPSLSDRNKDRNNSPKINDKEREKDRNAIDREKVEKLQKEKEKANFEKDKLDRLKAEKEKIERDIERLNKDRERLEKTRSMLESKSSKLNEKPKSYSKEEISSKKSIDLKSQNTYRIDKNSNEKRSIAPNKMGPTKQIHQNGHSSQGKPVPKLNKEQILKDRLLVKQKTSTDDRSPKLNGHSKAENGRNIPDNKKMDDRRPAGGSAGPSKVAVQNTFDFDKHVSSLKNGSRQFPPGDVKRKPRPDDVRKKNRRMVPSDSEYDSEMDDFIDDGEEDMDYSTHIKEIFGYDKSKYRNMDDDDDPTMESSFSRQQREEYISKKIGIMEDLEDMRLEAMQKKKSKKGRRISDD